MDADQFTGFFHDASGGTICYRESSGIGIDPIVTNIFLEPVGYFLWQENHLGLSAAFRFSDNDLPVFEIRGGEFQDLADSHTTPGHEFEHEPVSWVVRSENNFIDNVLFEDFELGELPAPE